MDSKGLQSQSQTIQDSNSISIYEGKLSKIETAKQTIRIALAFPKMPEQTIEILRDRFIENNFNDERMIASVNHVIDNYEGWDKVPNIANFIQYDKTIRFYTGRELKEKYKDSYYAGATYDPIAKEYCAVDINVGELRWIKKEHQKKYKIKLWNKVKGDSFRK